MKTISQKTFFFLILLAIIIPIGCFSPLLSTNGAVVTVSLGGQGRAVCFAGDEGLGIEDELVYTITFTNTATNKVIAAEIEKTAGAVSGTAMITPGTWKIRVEALFSGTVPIPPAVPGELYAVAVETHNIYESKTIPIKMQKPVTVHFESNGGSAVESQIVPNGGLIEQPEDPTKSGNTFSSWYKESALTNLWNFNTDKVDYFSYTPPGELTLYAKWDAGSGHIPSGNVTVAAGGYHTLAIKTDGTLWAWGWNSDYQLGDGTTTDHDTPIQIGTATDWMSVSAGDLCSFAIKTNGTLWAWGDNSSGQLGDGTTTAIHTPTQIGTDTNWMFVSTSILSTSYNTVALKTDGSIWAWGENNSGQLGDGTFTDSYIPVRESTGATDWKSVSLRGTHVIALKTDGSIYTWGSNGAGELCDGTTTNRPSPIRIGTENDWQAISAGATWFTFAIKTNGTLWGWGSNGSYNLGDNTTTDRDTPTWIGTDTDWKTVTAGRYRTLAIKTDGSLYGWGLNSEGQLGDGTITQRQIPTHIGTDTDWETVYTGESHTLARKTDGSLWAWGDNWIGQLGDGTNTTRRTPVPINVP